jgi:hypothetical protein
MPTRTITGTILRPDGSPWADGQVRFTPTDDTFRLSPDQTLPHTTVTVLTNDSGVFTVELVSGLDVAYMVRLPSRRDTFNIVVPDGSATTLEALRAAYVGVPAAADNVTTLVAPLLALKADASALTAHTGNTANPHAVTKGQVGLGSVDNTADSAKPVSTAQQTALNAKADTTALTEHTGNTANPHAVTKAQVGLGNVPNTDATARANHTGTQLAATVSDFASSADARIAAAAGVSVASLSGGKVPTSQIPALGLVTVQVAASQAAQLALTTQEGDVVVRTDENKTYMRNAGVSGTMADFTLLNTPTDLVQSVNGQTGVVVLAKGDVGLGNVDNTSDASKNSAIITLNNKTIDGGTF